MIRGDRSGRVPFALVAVLLLLSAGLAALYSAKLGRDEAAARAREARLAVLSRVAEEIHREVFSQAQFIALTAIAAGTNGTLNESKVSAAFSSGLAAYVAAHFPRVVQSVAVRVSAYEATLGLAQRRMLDVQPSNSTRTEVIDGVPLQAPDPTARDSLGPIDRVAYMAVRGVVNYSLSMDALRLVKLGSLGSLVPVPAPLMQRKLEQAARSGEGDAAGVGRTVKAILASLVQFRVLDGVASPMRPGTSTRDVLTANDVELAVNTALLVEQIRLFRAYDRDAASAIDAAHPAPHVPEDLPPPGRSLVQLLNRYVGGGTLDATDLFALLTGLDAAGLSMASLFAQAIAALADDLVLRPLEFLGLTPLADWLANATLQSADAFDSFLSWLTGQPDRYARYVVQYVRAVFVDTGVGTGFFGPWDQPLPARGYDVPNGSGRIRITIPSHVATVPFPRHDLLSADYNPFWHDYYSRLRPSLAGVGGTLRSLLNDVASTIAHDAVLAGLLPTSATGAIDPKDSRSFLDLLGLRVGHAVDLALARFGSDPIAVDGLTVNFWNATKAMLRDLVDYLTAGHDVVLVNATTEIGRARNALTADLFVEAVRRFPALNDSQKGTLRSAIDSDVIGNGWDLAAYAGRRAVDLGAFHDALALADSTSVPGFQMRARMREEVAGATGWLASAADSIKGLIGSATAAQDVAGLRVAYAATTDPFVLSDPWTGEPGFVERFRVRQSPAYLRANMETSNETGAGGSLAVAIVDPSELPASEDTPNAHLTKLGAQSHRPFATGWRVRVAGAALLRIETATAVLVGSSGLVPAALEKTWSLNFSLSLVAYSGWNLTGVSYRASDSLMNSIASFIDLALPDLTAVVRWMLVTMGRGLEIVSMMMERLSDFAFKVVRALSELLSRLLDFLRMVATQALGIVGRILDAIRIAFPVETRFTVAIAGVIVRVLVNGPAGRSLTLEFEWTGPHHVEFVRLLESEYRDRARRQPTYDVLAHASALLGPLHQSLSVDPLNVTQPHMIEGNASWEHAWRANYFGPTVQAGLPIDASLSITVPVAPGIDVDVRVGIGALTIGIPLAGFMAAIERGVSEALSQLPEAESWEDVGRLTREIGERLTADLLDEVEGSLLEVGVYAQADVKAEVEGPGFRLALVVDGTAVREAIEWLIDNVARYFERGLDPFADAQYKALPENLGEHAALRAEFHFVAGAPAFVADFGVTGEVRVAARVQANLAALAARLGHDAGRPEYEFAILLDGHVALPWLPGLYGVIYLLRGTAVPA